MLERAIKAQDAVHATRRKIYTALLEVYRAGGNRNIIDRLTHALDAIALADSHVDRAVDLIKQELQGRQQAKDDKGGQHLG